MATEAGKERVVAFLLKSGADPNLREGTRSQRRSPLIVAAMYGHLKIARMLVESGANVSYRDRVTKGGPEYTALDYARQEGHKKMTAYLKAVARPS